MNTIKDRIADALMAGCGTEIANRAAEIGTPPKYITDNSLGGDNRISLWRIGHYYAVNTNGYAAFENDDPETFYKLIENLPSVHEPLA